MKTSGTIVAFLILFSSFKISLQPKAVHANVLPTASNYDLRKSKVVLLDYYFNSEWKKDASGTNVRFHYVWEDKANSGFSSLGELFKKHGMQIASLQTAPTKKNLEQAGVYIIVDPDTEKETEKPNYITEEDANVIAQWVKKGGVLILMGNDSANANLPGLNVLSDRFGIHFNEDLFNPVIAKQYEQGAVIVPAHDQIFSSQEKLYLKEVSTLRVTAPATTVLSKDGKNIMAIARYGKGTVFAVGDPWIYNEYIDNHILPADFENAKGAEDLVQWAISQVKH